MLNLCEDLRFKLGHCFSWMFPSNISWHYSTRAELVSCCTSQSTTLLSLICTFSKQQWPAVSWQHCEIFTVFSWFFCCAIVITSSIIKYGVKSRLFLFPTLTDLWNQPSLLWSGFGVPSVSSIEFFGIGAINNLASTANVSEFCEELWLVFAYTVIDFWLCSKVFC